MSMSTEVEEQMVNGSTEGLKDPILFPKESREILQNADAGTVKDLVIPEAKKKIFPPLKPTPKEYIP